MPESGGISTASDASEAVLGKKIRLAESHEFQSWERPLPSHFSTTRHAKDFPIYTTQECDALLRAMTDGRTGANWKNDSQAASRVHQGCNLPHRVKLELTEQEREDGLDVHILEHLTAEQDADGCFAIMYVSRLLVPPAPLPPNTLAAGWIHLDDVAAKIWRPPRSTKEREAQRLAVYRYLLFGQRAELIGKRTGVYKDANTGREIPTQIDGPIWQFMDKERAMDTTVSLFPSTEVPLRVELAVSRDWSHLTAHPKLVQYLPMGELLGAIPGNQPSGAWARVIGLALANTWRRNPREILRRSLKPSRRELLTRYDPKTTTPMELLNGSDPRRAVQYWREALAILSGAGFLAREGETTRSEMDMLAAYSRKGWTEVWLSEPVDLFPGPAMFGAVLASANSLPTKKPRQLAPAKLGRRPRKNAATVK